MIRTAPFCLVGIFAIQVVLVATLGWYHQNQINPDGVAYLRIASYYAHGTSEHMVSGYWGPMLSWFMVPWLQWTSHLLAARIAMGISAIVFAAGSMVLFRKLELPPAGVVVGTALSALMSARFSVFAITPDLLMGGFLCLGAACLLSRHWPSKWVPSVAAGVGGGLAYLTKAVALPIFGGTLLIVSALWILCRPREARAVLLRCLVTACAFCLLAGPWILVLSLKYGRPVFSTTARIAHAYMGPGNVDRSHPMWRTFSKPESGRLTWWEDPTGMSYEYWSPFTSGKNLRHQLHIVLRNFAMAVRRLARMDLFCLGLPATILGFVLTGRSFREAIIDDRWRWAGIVIVCVCCPYLPVYAKPLRYFFPAYPFLIAAGLGLIPMLAERLRQRCSIRPWHAMAWIACSFALPQLSAIHALNWEMPTRSDWLTLANRLRAEQVEAPLAADDKLGLFVAFSLGQPFYGVVPDAAPDDFVRSGAPLIVVRRSAKPAQRLAASHRFRDLDPVLFPSPINAEACALKAFVSSCTVGCPLLPPAFVCDQGSRVVEDFFEIGSLATEHVSENAHHERYDRGGTERGPDETCPFMGREGARVQVVQQTQYQERDTAAEEKQRN